MTHCGATRNPWTWPAPTTTRPVAAGNTSSVSSTRGPGTSARRSATTSGPSGTTRRQAISTGPARPDSTSLSSSPGTAATARHCPTRAPPWTISGKPGPAAHHRPPSPSASVNPWRATTECSPRLRGDQRDEDVVHDLPQDVIGNGLERHQHFVAEQVEGQGDDPGGEPGRVDLPAPDRAVHDLLNGRAGAALAQERLAQLGRGGAGLVVVAAEHAAHQGRHRVAGGVGAVEQREQVAPERAGVGEGGRVGGTTVPGGRPEQVVAGLPAPVEHGLAGLGAGGDGVDGEVLVALGDQLLPGGVEDRRLELGAVAAGLRAAGLLATVVRDLVHRRILAEPPAVAQTGRRSRAPGRARAGMSAATEMPVAHQNAPWNAPTAPCASRDCRATATIAMPKEAPTCCAMRVFMVACGMPAGATSW